jgi:hypothetical protein
VLDTPFSVPDSGEKKEEQFFTVCRQHEQSQENSPLMSLFYIHRCHCTYLGLFSYFLRELAKYN